MPGENFFGINLHYLHWIGRRHCESITCNKAVDRRNLHCTYTGCPSPRDSRERSSCPTDHLCCPRLGLALALSDWRDEEGSDRRVPEAGDGTPASPGATTGCWHRVIDRPCSYPPRRQGLAGR